MKTKQKIDVAAYIWPAYTGKEPRTRMFWPEGIGEWETVKVAKPKCDRHIWPRVPLLGYQEEADPVEMEKQIELASSHGVNVFAYDWYWFDERPFLEQCLNDGFLGARNHDDMKFYLMWANHNANGIWDKKVSDWSIQNGSPTIWQGSVHPEVFREIGLRWLDRYFSLDCYYKIGGKPLLSIYDMRNFLKSFGDSVEEAKKAMLWLDGEAKARGLGGVHFQMIHQGSRSFNLSGVDGGEGMSYDELLRLLPFSSVTHYQYCHFTDVGRSYGEAKPDVIAEWERVKNLTDAAYFPHVSLGWDNNPRLPKTLCPNILTDNTPENIEDMLREAKLFAEKSGVGMVTVNAWNEWTEGSYLLPDDLNGYGYLDAVKKVFLDEK